MRLAALLVVLAACKGDAKAPAKAADNMDEKMRHCPLSIPGTTVTVSDSVDGVQFAIRGDATTRDEVIKRGRHIVGFAAGRSKTEHGGGQGGGTMRNCPVVTSGVEIAFDESSATLTVKPAAGGSVDELRRETKVRLERFSFEGVSIDRR